MEKLEKCDYGKVAGLFEGTNHGIPLIYSVIEGKGAGNLYVDSVSEPQNALILPQGGFSIWRQKTTAGISFCR